MDLAAAELEAVQTRLLALEAEKGNLQAKLSASRQEAAAAAAGGGYVSEAPTEVTRTSCIAVAGSVTVSSGCGKCTRIICGVAMPFPQPTGFQGCWRCGWGSCHILRRQMLACDALTCCCAVVLAPCCAVLLDCPAVHVYCITLALAAAAASFHSLWIWCLVHWYRFVAHVLASVVNYLLHHMQGTGMHWQCKLQNKPAGSHSAVHLMLDLPIAVCMQGTSGSSNVEETLRQELNSQRDVSARLRQDLAEARQALHSTVAEWEDKYAAVQEQLEQQVAAAEQLQRELQLRPTTAQLGELQQQVRALQAVGYGSVEDLPAAAGPAAGGASPVAAAARGTAAGGLNLEGMLLAKNRKLEHDATMTKLAFAEASQELESAKEQVGGHRN